MIEHFEAKLNEYAHLLVEIGMNVQPGQTPRIAGSIDCAPLMRLCAQVALDLGARDVFVDWTDDFVTRQRYLKADAQVFSEFPSYLQEKFDYMTAHGCPVLSIDSSDPQLLQGVDSQRIQAWRRVSGNSLRAYYDAMTAGQFQWAIGAYPTAAWAQKVFPELSQEDAVDALWDAIFATCRISGDGTAGWPVGGSTWTPAPAGAKPSMTTSSRPSTIKTRWAPISPLRCPNITFGRAAVN